MWTPPKPAFRPPRRGADPLAWGVLLLTVTAIVVLALLADCGTGCF